jgi:lysozyme family protein
MSDFERSLSRVLVHEGGYSNNPKDPGGATMKGVTQRVYDDFRMARSVPKQSVKLISQAEIATLYKTRYWDMFKGDKMPAGVNYVVFDGAVNSGVAQSVKWLQRALAPHYTGTIDGLVGEGTLRAIEDYGDPAELIDKICDLRLAFLKSLKTWPTFGRGWASRVNDVRHIGKSWATGDDTTHFYQTPDIETAKAPASDLAAPPSVSVGDATATGGGVAATISQAIGQLTPLASMPHVSDVITWLTIAGVVVAVGGLLYGLLARRRKAEIKEATGQ